ncbi:hypothetical protein EIP86_005790 [Pleurotus ostreatoroseus]|nr:hypothetical protein EIP86_005790 [Pleurotus ostreatoroseus]
MSGSDIPAGKMEAGSLSTMRGDVDEAELARMGYKQELNVITGVPSLFLYGLNTGGPAVMVWGFMVVAFFTMLVGLAMGGKTALTSSPGDQAE